MTQKYREVKNDMHAVQKILIAAAIAALALLSGCSDSTTEVGTTSLNTPIHCAGSPSVVTEATQLPETVPIYRNDYVYTQEGPAFAIDDALRAEMTGNLAEYLTLLYGEGDCAIGQHPEVPYQVLYTNAEGEFWSSATGISVIAQEEPITTQTEAADLVEVPLVQAALAYLGIETPSVSSQTEVGTDGAPYETQFTITEATEDPIQSAWNNSFASVQITCHEDTSEILLQIARQDPTPCEEEAPISLQEARKLLAAQHPNADTAAAELYYSATVLPGYYVPCFRFFLPEGDTVSTVDIALSSDVS
jgi:hypothetical protein